MRCETVSVGEATLTAYVHDISDACPHTKRPAILIFPGGGYDFCYDGEAEPIALAYLNAGLNAYVLRYSCREKAKFPRPLIEASQAMAYIRRQSERDNTDGARVFCIGFSAGGHLAAALATCWHRPEIQAEAGVVGEENRPSGAILSYPAQSGGEYRHKGTFCRVCGKEDPSEEERLVYWGDRNVDRNTPPMFLWHTAEDGCVPVENSLLMAAALSQNKIPFEMHIFPKGGHGLCLATEETARGDENAIIPEVAAWMPLSIDWIRRF